jgi:hypothetical protein
MVSSENDIIELVYGLFHGIETYYIFLDYYRKSLHTTGMAMPY